MPGVRFWFLTGWLILTSGLLSAQESEPLHVRIDKIIATHTPGLPAPLVDDGEFLRRLTLDLTGRVPSRAQLQNFLADQSPDRRTKLIDSLLQSPEFARHMTTQLDVMLMERRPYKYVTEAEWQAWLYQAVQENRPYHLLVRDLLAADGSEGAQKPAARFYMDRDGEAHLLTRDVGRIFFGRDMQCAQCHDHPLIDSYYQADYYGLYAFLQRSFIFQAEDKNIKPVFAEKAEGLAEFKSVFTEIAGTSPPRLLGGQDIPDPAINPGEEYTVKQDKNVRPVPKYSRRAKLAELATDGTNQAFNENIANRLWAMLLGRGLVHPVDLHHTNNRPLYPELLELLGREMPRLNYDLRAFLKQVALSQTYQRKLDFPSGLHQSLEPVQQTLAALKTEQTQLQQATAGLEQQKKSAQDQRLTAKQTLEATTKTVAEQQAAVTAAQTKVAELTKTAAATQEQQTKQQQTVDALSQAVTSSGNAQKLLPQPDTLKPAVDLLTAELQTSQTQLAAVTQTLQTQQTELTNANTTLTTVTAQLAAGMQQAAEQQAALQKLTAQEDELSRQHAASSTQQKALEQRLGFWEQVMAYGTQSGQLAAQSGPMNAQLAECNRCQAEIATRQQAITEKQTEQAALEQQLKQLAEQIARLEKQLTEQQATVKLVAQADEGLTRALQALPADSELADAKQKLAAKQAALQQAVTTQTEALTTGRSQQTAQQQTLTQVQTLLADLTKQQEAGQMQLAALTQSVEQQRQALQPLQAELDRQAEQLTEAFSQRLIIASLEPLAAEQLAWSMLTASGYLERVRAGTEAELQTAQPLSPEDLQNPEKVRARQFLVEQETYKKFKGNIDQFVNLFGASPGQSQYDFYATVDQALFLSNNGTLTAWVAPAGENLAQRLITQTQPEELARELYLSVLTRQPTPEETSRVTAYLQSRPEEKPAAVQDMIWALLTSAEFRFHP